MACKKRFLISSALPVLALILVGPVWAVPIVTYNEPPDGVNFVLTIFEAAFATQNPAVPPQTKGFWLVNVTQLSEVRTAAGMNDTVAISGNARHLRGPVDDPVRGRRLPLALMCLGRWIRPCRSRMARIETSSRRRWTPHLMRPVER